MCAQNDGRIGDVEKIGIDLKGSCVLQIENSIRISIHGSGLMRASRRPAENKVGALAGCLSVSFLAS